MVTHDQRLIEDTGCDVALSDEGRVRRLDGGFDEYRRLVMARKSLCHI